MRREWQPSSETARRASPHSLSRTMLSRVSRGVRTSRARRCQVASRESQPVITKTGTSMAAISIDEVFCLSGAEFQRVAHWLVASATVYARQVAGLGGLPDGDERPFIEVGMPVHVASLIPGMSSTSNTMADRRALVCDVSHVHLTFLGKQQSLCQLRTEVTPRREVRHSPLVCYRPQSLL